MSVLLLFVLNWLCVATKVNVRFSIFITSTQHVIVLYTVSISTQAGCATMVVADRNLPLKHIFVSTCITGRY